MGNERRGAGGGGAHGVLSARKFDSNYEACGNNKRPTLVPPSPLDSLTGGTPKLFSGSGSAGSAALRRTSTCARRS